MFQEQRNESSSKAHFVCHCRVSFWLIFGMAKLRQSSVNLLCFCKPTASWTPTPYGMPTLQFLVVHAQHCAAVTSIPKNLCSAISAPEKSQPTL
ncbi:hypothetical protein BABINDRAFT_99842 [Babjeviella inositovora NRRL Y-12698]|uniref:Uncharacterized protein n=1 Tax=Babjeviella inositovora NRRL Y-12698 TaxID=984486 RepID=A0A1E3QHV7_9ASCO|nr:uncharacterized protein BABINDRAFT_99842 [Babjeviella inositovora NRRL Y-12698]ODQ77279.1 hypothetical protein BABINDRAFT_99842 [Babjeviella inositovora NRRL Y-12698]